MMAGGFSRPGGARLAHINMSCCVFLVRVFCMPLLPGTGLAGLQAYILFTSTNARVVMSVLHAYFASV